MQPLQSELKKALLFIVALGIIISAVWISYKLFLQNNPPPPPPQKEVTLRPKAQPTHDVIGTSVEGRQIESYTFTSDTTDTTHPKRHIVFVGGVHGGYEWNSVALAYHALDYITEQKASIPPNTTVTIIPSLNPDGVFAGTGHEGRFTEEDIAADEARTEKTKEQSRFNAHNVDLNRNFGCKWQPTSMWRGTKVSAGTEAFSEPEAAALKSYVEKLQTMEPSAQLSFVFWHSQANAVYASECKNGILEGTRTLMNTYAHAASYKTIDTFDAYPVTGDAEGWLASINIPAITVELSSHDSVEWDKNKKGVDAVVFNK